MLRLESITPLGNPVVPDVYCMLITRRADAGAARVELGVSDARRRQPHLFVGGEPVGRGIADVRLRAVRALAGHEDQPLEAGDLPAVAPIAVSSLT